jgi:O-antigen ligase
MDRTEARLADRKTAPVIAVNRALSRFAERASFISVLALPILLLHATSVAEVAIGFVDVVFLARLATEPAARRAVRAPWVVVAALWWAWLIFCSLPGIGAGGWPSLLQAVISARYLLLVAALESWLLAGADARRWLGRVVTLSWLYYAAHIAAQFTTGRNLFGVVANADGVLTDPIGRARVAAPLSRMLAPVLVPVVAPWLAQRRPSRWLAALALTVAAIAILLVVGQRMPFLLGVFALVIAAALLPRLRPVVLIAVIAAGLIIAGSAVFAPVVFGRLVTQFSLQMEHFRTSDYGLIYDRAMAMAEQHPWLGRGFDGFRTGCADPRYFTAIAHAAPPPLGGGVAGCNIHPHNHYLQVLTDSGIPGLVLFAGLILTWLAALFRGLLRRPDPLRVSLFAAALIDQWPIASTSSLYAVEIEGFFFLLLGWGLAEARAARIGLPARDAGGSGAA